MERQYSYCTYPYMELCFLDLRDRGVLTNINIFPTKNTDTRAWEEYTELRNVKYITQSKTLELNFIPRKARKLR